MHPHTQFFIVNWDGTNFCQSRFLLGELHAKVNLAAHAFIFPAVLQGDSMKENVYEALFMTEHRQGRQPSNSSLGGVNPCHDDNGRLPINPSEFLHDSNLREVFVHPSDDGLIAISPNNATFLLNLSQPLVSFVVVLKRYNSAPALFQMTVMTNRFDDRCRQLEEVLSSLHFSSYKPSNLLSPSDHSLHHNKVCFGLRSQYHTQSA